MPKTTLHIVDGDSTGGTMRIAGFRKQGEILVWREALYTGPVPAGLSLRRLSRIRSRFFTQKDNDLAERDAMLAEHARYEKIALWFGKDCVLCQLSLIQVLSWFREQGQSAKRLSWIPQEGGRIPPAKMPWAFARRRPITQAHVRLAERAWRAFRQPDPRELVRLLRSEMSAAPGLDRALTRMLQEYPDRRSGLSRLERLLLTEIRRRGECRVVDAMISILRKETVGDLLLLETLSNFVSAQHPLLEFSEPFSGNLKNYEFNRAVLRLTETGKRVLAGKSDAVELNGIDRWIGGTHLRGHKIGWRWDRAKGELVSIPS